MEKETLLYISREKLSLFMNGIAKEVDLFFAPKMEGEICHLRNVKEELDSYQYNPEKRPLEPLKMFIFPPKEIVAHYFGKDSDSSKKPVSKQIVWGIKACDLTSLETWKVIFAQGELAEPEYKKRLDSTILVSSDCTNVGETCFCHLLEGEPYSREGFDLNLSPTKDGFIIEIGSEKGKKLIVQNKELFRQTSSEERKIKEKDRAKCLEELKEVNKHFEFKKPLTEIMKSNYESFHWKDVSQDCIECGACTNICPTCYCFLLYDGKKKDLDEYLKMKIWDSCQLLNFARVAGGENPRKKLFERVRYRLTHKFDYFPDGYDLIACTGCGRCIDACMGKIDMREIFKKLDECKKE